MRKILSLVFLAGIAASGMAQQKVQSYEKAADGLWLTTNAGMIHLQPVTDGVLRVSIGSKANIDTLQTFAIDSAMVKATQAFNVTDGTGDITLSTPLYSVKVDKNNGNISLLDASGRTLVLDEASNKRSALVNDSIQAFARFKVQTSDEALYGLGQHRDTRMNLRGATRYLEQKNTRASVPVLLSTGGWGVFWNNGTRTVYNQGGNNVTFTSDYGKAIDYYLFVGDKLDKLVSRYRTLTGKMPMLPEWALGFHQSRNRYHNRSELMEVVKRMHDEKIPMSSIFIDYHYWDPNGTGSMVFNEKDWPNLEEMLDSMRNTYNTHAVVTLWPSFDEKTDNYKKLQEKGYLLTGSKGLGNSINYDVFNPGARKMFREMIKPLISHSIDGWFLDGCEPDQEGPFLKSTTFYGSAQRVRDLFPLFNTSNFYQAYTEMYPNKRPYILTRCAWAGQQKYGTAVWSGDINTDFDELKKQITSGLNFTAAGIPYWTTDIGGYNDFGKGGNVATDKAYREVYTRWFQYGTFCPIFRTHGRRKGDGPNELWAYGDTVQKICTYYINLRYRMMPYIYSMSHMVTKDDYTPMRLLAFDFPDDKKVLDLKDEFMYGAFLVCPVTEAGATSRDVYLPNGTKWIDFYTKKVYDGGQTITADAPIERMPLFVKAGSIIPLEGDSIEVWPGADAEFTLYEDDGLTMNYKKGDYTETRLQWNDNAQELTVTPTTARKFTVVNALKEGDVTGINNVKYNNGKTSGSVYDVSGRKVADNMQHAQAGRALPSGIYILDGKKVAIK